MADFTQQTLHFQLNCSSDEVDNCVSVVSDAEFGLLGQLIKLGEIVFDGVLSLLQCKECCFCVLYKGGGFEGFLELFFKAGKQHGVDTPCCDHQVCKSSSHIISFHIGENDQHFLLISRIHFKAT